MNDPITLGSVWGPKPRQEEAFVVKVEDGFITYRSLVWGMVVRTSEAGFRAMFPVYIARTIIE